VNDEQTRDLQSVGRLAVASLVNLLMDRGDEIVRLAVQRASSIGTAEYGDTAWLKTDDDLRVDVLEELADAVFYQHIVVDRRNRRLHRA
jgi:hypothetical protein